MIITCPDTCSLIPVASVGNTTQPQRNEREQSPPVNCLIDYIQGILIAPTSDIPHILLLFSSLFREEETIIDCVGKSFGSTKFQHGAMTLNKQRFAWTDSDDKGMSRLWFSVPGKVLSRVPDITTLRGLDSILSPYEFKVSRIDLALDDYLKILNAAYIDEMKVGKRFVGNPTITPIGYAEDEGWTRYIGSRRSLVFLRLYDKFFESGGKIDANRLEGEFKGRVANEHYANLQAISFTAESIAAYIVEAVTGAVRIVSDDNAQKHLCSVEPTWEKFLNHCQSKGGFRVPQPRRESSIAKTMQWLERSVKSSLATVKQALGADRFKAYFDKFLKDGRAALSTRQIHLLKLLGRGDDTLSPPKPKLNAAKGFTSSVNNATNAMMNRIMNDKNKLLALSQV